MNLTGDFRFYLVASPVIRFKHFIKHFYVVKELPLVFFKTSKRVVYFHYFHCSLTGTV
jgi:hypothetical protein